MSWQLPRSFSSLPAALTGKIAPVPAEQNQIHTARLRWRCRRGMRELDVVLQGYLQNCYPQAPATEQRAFETLLELQDPQLFAYLLGSDAPNDPELLHVIARLAQPRT